ncbi:MAG: UMP kinase [Spirochaetia bacterium]|nr:UMP kinase [Spirochaetia bacterium]
MSNLAVLSLGGSIIAPDKVDIEFLKSFDKAIREYLKEDKENKLILVCGGGAPARVYQNAYREIASNKDNNIQDWIGIKATHLNAQLVYSIFNDLCSDEVVTNPSADIKFTNQVLIAAGWKPGFSTDTDAVFLSQRFGGKLIVNLSNIAKVYTADPKLDPTATPIDNISWTDFRKMVGDEWVPGKNCPFDPIASKGAQKENMKVICADGRNIENTLKILRGESFYGTTIG